MCAFNGGLRRFERKALRPVALEVVPMYEGREIAVAALSSILFRRPEVSA